MTAQVNWARGCRSRVEIRDLQIRLRVRVRVFQCVPVAHARLRKAVTSTRSVVKISSPTTSSLQVQRRVKRLVFKRADTL